VCEVASVQSMVLAALISTSEISVDFGATTARWRAYLPRMRPSSRVICRAPFLPSLASAHRFSECGCARVSMGADGLLVSPDVSV
jgi:hypothetical protein